MASVKILIFDRWRMNDCNLIEEYARLYMKYHTVYSCGEYKYVPGT